VVFGVGTTLATTQNIAGGLTLNSLAFTADAGAYTVAGTQPLIFSGTAPAISSFSTAVGHVTVSVPLQLAQNVTVTGDAGDFAGQLNLTGIISGTGRLQWSSGVGSLSGVNTYSGGTTISGGGLAISKSSGLGTGAVVINGGSLQLQESGLFNPVTIARPLTISGSGAEGLAALHSAKGSNTWSGAVTLAGPATIGSFIAAAAEFSSLLVSSGVTLAGNILTVDARTDSTTSFSGVISGAGGLIKTGDGTFKLSNNANSFTGNVRIEAGTLDTQQGGDKLGILANTLTAVVGSTLHNTNLSAGRSVILEGTGFVNATNTSDVIIAANLSGTGGLRVNSGILELNGTNTFSGGLTVGTGSGSVVLNVKNIVAFGAVGNVVTLDAGRINFQPTASSFALGASQALVFGSGGATFGTATGKTITVAGDLSGAGRLSLRALFSDNVAGGSYVLTGNNTFAGGVLVSRTTLSIGADSALGSSTGTLDITNGTLRATGSFAIAGTRSSTFVGNAKIDTQDFTLTFGQPILGDGQLVKIGGGTLILGATSTAATSVLLQVGAITTTAVDSLGIGNVDLSSGTTLSLGANQQLSGIGGSGAIVTLPGSTLTLTGASNFFGGTLTGGALIALSGSSASYAPSVTPDSNFSLNGGQILAMNDLTLDAARTINLTADGGKLAAVDDNTLTVNSVISGVGGLTTLSYNSDFTRTGSAVVALNATNTYAGGTTIPGGVLIAGTDSALGLGPITLSGGTLSAAGARTFAQPMTLGAPAPADFDNSRLSGDAMTFGGNWTLTGNRTLEVENIATLNGALGGGSFGFTKSGSGTLTLGGANTYTGATAVNEGTLLVNGSLASAAVSVASGATLGGGGTFAGLTALANGGILAPGNSPGTITFNAGLSLDGGSILNFELGTASDLIVVGGGRLSGPTSGTVTLNFSDSGGFGAGTYTLINYATAAGTRNFSPDSFTLGSTVGDYNYTLGLSGNTLQLTANAIPEPSTYATIFGTAALGFAVWRRRNRV
jgi:autotransporter-associated beta strand protein